MAFAIFSPVFLNSSSEGIFTLVGVFLVADSLGSLLDFSVESFLTALLLLSLL